jgi:hypothetical protein
MATATLMASITGPIVTPATITFVSPDPDASPANGNATATITWTMNGKKKSDWQLTVQAATPALTACPTVPASAIAFTCSAATLSGNGRPRGGCASGTFPLSTQPQAIASGNRQGGNASATAVVSFAFTDAWRYVPHSACSIDLIYKIAAED